MGKWFKFHLLFTRFKVIPPWIVNFYCCNKSTISRLEGAAFHPDAVLTDYSACRLFKLLKLVSGLSNKLRTYCLLLAVLRHATQIAFAVPECSHLFVGRTTWRTSRPALLDARTQLRFHFKQIQQPQDSDMYITRVSVKYS